MTRTATWRHAAQVLVLISACLVAAGCAKAQSATYYLSPSGNDAAAGTSPSTAWRSLGRASRADLKPGNRLLLQGGSEFSGQLTLSPRDDGLAGRPVVVGSYGGGVATIVSSGAAVYLYDTANVEVSDLSLRGEQPAGLELAGLSLYNDLPAGHRLSHIVIKNVNVAGFAEGIAMGGRNDGAGFSDVSVSDSTLTGNVNDGFISYGPQFKPEAPSYANQDVTVTHVVATGNQGDPDSVLDDTGNGIVLGSVNGGMISWSTADNNGGDSVAGEGPAGIWAYDSTKIAIEHDVSFANRTGNRVDGNGFGLDQNTSDSVMENDLSYANDGTGFLVYSGKKNGAQKDNVVRNDISSGDSQDGNASYGGISVLGRVAGTDIYQNTVVMAASRPAPALRLGRLVRGLVARNNLFVTDHSPIVSAEGALPPGTAYLQGNDYWSVAAVVDSVGPGIVRLAAGVAYDEHAGNGRGPVFGIRRRPAGVRSGAEPSADARRRLDGGERLYAAPGLAPDRGRAGPEHFRDRAREQRISSAARARSSTRTSARSSGAGFSNGPRCLAGRGV